MITYQMKFQPLHELVCFLEHYINHETKYESLERYTETEQEKSSIRELHKLCVQIGETFFKQFSEHAFLFTYFDVDKATSPIKTMMFGGCDYTTDDVDQQIASLRRYYEGTSRRFIEEVISVEKEGMPDKNCSEEALWQQYDELLIPDELKWKLWRLQYQLPTIFDALTLIAHTLFEILEQYQGLYEDFFNEYKKELEENEPLGGLYENLTAMVGYLSNTTDIVLFPTMAGCRSVSFCDQREGSNVVIYGVGTFRRLLADTSISDETLCSNLKLLSDKSKFDILRFISKEKAYGAQIAAELKLSTPTISYHMQALLCAQMVTFEKDNNRLYYRVNESYVREFLKQVEERLLK